MPGPEFSKPIPIQTLTPSSTGGFPPCASVRQPLRASYVRRRPAIAAILRRYGDAYELTSVFPWPHAFVFTMLRGEYVEPGQPADSISPLTPNKNAIFLGKVSLSQTAIVEPMLSRYRFDSWTDTGMGQMMRSIYKRTGAIAYSPRLAVFYKAMETARWGKLPTDPLPFAPTMWRRTKKRLAACRGGGG